MFTCSNIEKKKKKNSQTVNCSTSIHPLSEQFILVPVSLRPPSQIAQCALIGHLPQAWAGTTWHVLALHRIWQTDEAKYLKITK